MMTRRKQESPTWAYVEQQRRAQGRAFGKPRGGQALIDYKRQQAEHTMEVQRLLAAQRAAAERRRS